MVMARSRDAETHAIIGAAMEVHRQLGHGFLEHVYQEALTIEFNQLSIPARKEVSLDIRYKDKLLKCTYKADFICYQSVIVEIKALRTLSTTEEAQLINYLKASGHHRGLLLNFGAPSLQYRRLVFTDNGARARI